MCTLLTHHGQGYFPLVLDIFSDSAVSTVTTFTSHGGTPMQCLALSEDVAGARGRTQVEALPSLQRKRGLSVDS